MVVFKEFDTLYLHIVNNKTQQSTFFYSTMTFPLKMSKSPTEKMVMFAVVEVVSRRNTLFLQLPLWAEIGDVMMM